MGVCTCDRKGCDNVMCERFSQRYGHLCTDCFEQLIVYMASAVGADIREFIESEKVPNALLRREQARQVLEVEFKTREERGIVS